MTLKRDNDVASQDRSPGWWVYMLRCGDGSLYTGVTSDLERRIGAHGRGRGARYTRGRGPFSLIYREACGNRGIALKREAEIKKLDRKAKLALARGCDCG